MLLGDSFDTPILFIVFNRPITAQRVFDQIKKVKPKYLFIAADGPRKSNSDDVENCLKVKRIIQQVDWECRVETLFREENLGCGLAVSSAITWFFKNVNEGVILEDDCFPDLSFFYYCKSLLNEYRNIEKVMHIGGNNFQKKTVNSSESYYFSNYNHIWGWATWRRAWDKYDYEMRDFQNSGNTGLLNNVFRSSGERKYWNKVFLLTSQMKMNTWDYQWTYAIWKNKGVSITPNCNLVVNIGFTENSTHNFLKDSYRDKLTINSIKFPLISPNEVINFAADRFTFKNLFGNSVQRIFRLIKENGLLAVSKVAFKRFFK
jgi:hypothetical protein